MQKMPNVVRATFMIEQNDDQNYNRSIWTHMWKRQSGHGEELKVEKSVEDMVPTRFQ